MGESCKLMNSLTKTLQHLSLARVAGTHGVIRDTEKVMPGSRSIIHAVKIAQNDPKDKDSEFESFVFWMTQKT